MTHDPAELRRRAAELLTVEAATRGLPGTDDAPGWFSCPFCDPGADEDLDRLIVDEKGFACTDDDCSKSGDLLELAAEVRGVSPLDVVQMLEAIEAKRRTKTASQPKPQPPPPPPPAPLPPLPPPPPSREPRRERTLDEWLAALDARGWDGRRTGQEYAGPCPVCGGEDRFHVGPGRKREVVAGCRKDCKFEELVKEVFGKGDPLPSPVPSRSAPRDDLDRSKLDHAGLARALVDALTLTPPGKEYLRRRGLDPDRLEEYGWRSVDSARDWVPLAGLPEAHGWPRWPWGQPRWPMSCHRDGALVMPYRDRRGRLAGVRFRPGKGWRADYRLREARAAPKALSMPRGPNRLYGAEALRSVKRVVHVAEGEIDTESLREYDVIAVGAPGASIWRSEWTRWLAQRAARAVLWFDDDDAGGRGGTSLRDMSFRNHISL